jgi:polyhydroxybutyrate depolymerase
MMQARQFLYCVAACAIAITAAVHFGTDTIPGAVALGAQEASIQVGGQERSYILAGPQSSGPLPTLIFLHGKGGSAAKARWMGFEQLGERERFVTVLPNGIDGEWNVFPPGFRDRTGRSTNGTDSAFIKQLVDDLVHRGIADPRRIYLGGISNGGLMALRMACDAPELFAAIGVFLASMPANTGQDCHPSRPMPLLMMNGTADQVVPYNGGITAGGLKVWGTERTITFFRQLNGCNMEPKRSNTGQSDYGGMESVVVDRWTACSGAPIVLYSVVGGGHRQPGGAGGGMGGSSAAQTLWDFFHDKSAANN